MITPDSNTETHPTPISQAPPAQNKRIWERLRWRRHNLRHKPVEANVQTAYEATLSPMDRFAVRVTERVGSIGFFVLIMTWTIGWCGYNILASTFKPLHWTSFDPFPAFVAYLLMSNVIQLLLMPLILIGQNLQSRFADTRSQMDFEINRIAGREAAMNLRHMEHQTNLLLLLLKSNNVVVPEAELQALEETLREEEEMVAADPLAPRSSAARSVER